MTCVLEDAHEGGTFVELRLKGRLGPDMPYRSVNVRPVLLKGKRHLQFAYFTEKQNVVKNEEVGGRMELCNHDGWHIHSGTHVFCVKGICEHSFGSSS